MVSWWRFELQTDRLEGDCSIQLSYQDIRQYKLYTNKLKKYESEIAYLKQINDIYNKIRTFLQGVAYVDGNVTVDYYDGDIYKESELI